MLNWPHMPSWQHIVAALICAWWALAQWNAYRIYTGQIPSPTPEVTGNSHMAWRSYDSARLFAMFSFALLINPGWSFAPFMFGWAAVIRFWRAYYYAGKMPLEIAFATNVTADEETALFGFVLRRQPKLAVYHALVSALMATLAYLSDRWIGG